MEPEVTINPTRVKFQFIYKFTDFNSLALFKLRKLLIFKGY